MKKIILYATIPFLLVVSCNNGGKVSSETKSQNMELEKINKDMNSFISMFEIPATDISRAIRFYENILGISIEHIEIPEMEMGVFPYEDQVVTGIIAKGEDYVPSSNGVTLYFDGGDDLQIILDKVEVNGGEVVVPKTPHADESGFFALFLDSEGNRIGLNSPN